MKIHKDITLDRVMDAITQDDFIGFCIACGLEAWECEPDLCSRLCEECGESAIYGAEHILVMMA